MTDDVQRIRERVEAMIATEQWLFEDSDTPPAFRAISDCVSGSLKTLLDWIDRGMPDE